MTRSDQLAAIRQKCIEANSKIVEKQTGCWISWGGGIKYVSMILFQNDAGNFIVWDDQHGRQNVRWSQVIEIIGRPIRLADVLLAVGDADHAIAGDGQFLEYAADINTDADLGNEGYEDTGKFWNLRTDDLTQQSDETVAFIHSLLCV